MLSNQWFSGFIAEAVSAGRVDSYDNIFGGYARCGRWCGSIKAAAVFGAFNWILFLATTILAALHLSRGRKNPTANTTGGAPMAGV